MSEVRLSFPVKAIKFDRPLKVFDGADPPGSIYLQPDADGNLLRLQYLCPCGCGAFSALPIRPKDGSPDWKLDVATLTLTPSINHVGHWHGYLKNGEWVDA